MEAPDTVDHGRLQLDEVLGEGAQAVVHAARRGDTSVAVKLVHAQRVSPRFVGEVAALKAVRHPHVVRILGAGTDGDWHWIEMERLEGRTLDTTVRDDGALDVPRSLAVAFELCMGLTALHDRGIVHRDIKPSNVFLTDARRVGPDGVPSQGPAGGRVVLADLGVAQLPAGDMGYATVTGTALGTMDYAAPEQHGDAKRVGPAADQYGVGATLYALAAGKRPSYLYAPEDMPHIYERCPAPLRDLITRCCAHDPERRFADVRALARALAERHASITGEDSAVTWMAAFDDATPLPPFWWRWWYAFRRWLR